MNYLYISFGGGGGGGGVDHVITKHHKYSVVSHATFPGQESSLQGLIVEAFKKLVRHFHYSIYHATTTQSRNHIAYKSIA